jgi:hypothetical protein
MSEGAVRCNGVVLVEAEPAASAAGPGVIGELDLPMRQRRAGPLGNRAKGHRLLLEGRL